MKVTPEFKKAIETHLKEVADNDNLFAVAFAKPNKNIDDCITYILNVVKKSEISGYAREEIFSMAIHYYDEDNIEIGNPIMDCHVVVSHRVELTAEQKAKATEDAIREIQDKARKQLEGTRQNHKQKPSTIPITPTTSTPSQTTLF